MASASVLPQYLAPKLDCNPIQSPEGKDSWGNMVSGSPGITVQEGILEGRWVDVGERSTKLITNSQS